MVKKHCASFRLSSGLRRDDWLNAEDEDAADAGETSLKMYSRGTESSDDNVASSMPLSSSVFVVEACSREAAAAVISRVLLIFLLLPLSLRSPSSFSRRLFRETSPSSLSEVIIILFCEDIARGPPSL
eukprot:CAMPEP_0168761844 /NCGR_PEP_ID=MMETSP0724-20121128/23531_1 /TAXON_ID=265536 /ORGANISM="Amphiprora sp., Strain CCMP467" /LENGTH=127 /DNA_ID=CAMNT_0008810977 /DNA_START=200 /DNA_END=580 /DNA_ORIENTATION=-